MVQVQEYELPSGLLHVAPLRQGELEHGVSEISEKREAMKKFVVYNMCKHAYEFALNIIGNL